MGIPLRLALVGLVGSARGFELSAPLAGLACDSDADGETLELGHRQLDVTVANWLDAGTSLCAEECEQIAGCTTFHVMQSNGCIDEVGPDVCVPWAECTFFSRCEALQHGDEDWMDCSSTAYFLTDRTSAPAVPSTADRRQMSTGADMMDMTGLSLPNMGGFPMTSMSNVFQGNSLPPTTAGTPGGAPGGGPSGEKACENMGFDQSACAAVGCCQFDDGKCWSAVGGGACSGGMPEGPDVGPSPACRACCPVGVCETPADGSKPECAACIACIGSGPSMPGSGTCPVSSPFLPPPSPAPEMPGTTFVTKPAKEFKITVTVAGTVDTFDKAGYEAGMRTILSCEAPLCQVAIAVTAASVNVEATVTDATSGGSAVAMADTLKTLTKEDLQARITAVLPGVVVESAATVTAPIEVELIVPVAAPVAASPSPPAEPDRVGGPGVGLTKGSDQTTTNDAGLGAGLGLGLGLPIFCAFLFFLHVQMNFEDGKRSKYIKYRFSHTNAQINFGYMPKESRDALWAEIKAPAEQSSRETGVEIPAPKEEKTDTV